MDLTRDTRMPTTSEPIAERGDLSRTVYCVLGMPIDVVDFATALRRIEDAAKGQAPFLLSTPNLNFLVNFQTSPEFRDALLLSDLCPADGIAIVWLARLLGVPLRERVAGSDLFEALKRKRDGQKIRVFLFGGDKGVAVAAAAQLNSPGLVCVGALDPGFGSVEDMSGPDILRKINASDAQFLIASLGAVKGQAWLLRNHSSLRVPVRSHLGAVMNFEAGTVKRAPSLLRRLGLEWLWRIKEEPRLWTRYAHDGFILLRLLVTRVAPLRALALWQRLTGKLTRSTLDVTTNPRGQSTTIQLCGFAVQRTMHPARVCFQLAVAGDKHVVLDCSRLHYLDARFLGLLLMLRKQLLSRGLSLTVRGAKGWPARIVKWHGLDFLLSDDGKGST
jgi:N-acetylglucosaminyldiphosphoundecaprenol N-acetyl-beta-D-mannosaminyltransferase